MNEEPKFLETADIETASEDYATRFSGGVGQYFLDLQLEIVLSLLARYEGNTILDVGGGHAQLAVPLVKKGYQVTVTGSDESCRSRLDAQLTAADFSYQTCDMLALPYDDMSFDVVLAFRLIPHVERWPELMRELSRVARYGVVVDYPDIRSSNFLNSLLFSFKKNLEGNTRPFTLFTRNQILTEFSRAEMGQAVLKPEFFFPMVLHRKLNSSVISSFLEKVAKYTGLTRFFGSPIVTSVKRTDCAK